MKGTTSKDLSHVTSGRSIAGSLQMTVFPGTLNCVVRTLMEVRVLRLC